MQTTARSLTRRSIIKASAALAGAGMIPVATPAVAAAAPPGPAVDPRFREAVDRIDAYAAAIMASRGTPGVSLAVTDRSGVLFTRQYGYANLAARTPVLPETRFAFGSIGKTFTALLVLQLVDEGKIDLAAPVTRYLPWFSVRSDYPPITIHDLLTHTSGLIFGSDFAPDAKPEVWPQRNLGVLGPPGAQFLYSNVGYKTLGLVIEAVTGMPYRRAIQERAFDPLGMEHAANAITNAIRGRIATGHVPVHDDRPAPAVPEYVEAPWIQTSTGDGSLAASASELTAFLRVLLNRGAGPSGPLLRPETFDLMTQPFADMGNGTKYGYAMFNGELDGRFRIGHTGSVIGYASVMFGLPDVGVGVVALANEPDHPMEITRFALRAVAAVMEGVPVPSAPEIADPMVIRNAADFAGSFEGEDETIAFEAAGTELVLVAGGRRISLYRRGEDAFLAADPDFGLYLLRFARDEAGRVTEVTYGPKWYRGRLYSGPEAFDTPQAWAAYPGHYRNHNPWWPSLRVGIRKGDLWVFRPDGSEDRLAMTETGFRPPPGENSPLRLSFDEIVDGKAQRARWNDGDDFYYRFFTD